MDSDDFFVAKIMDNEGWLFHRTDGEWMVFTRIIGGVTYTARIGKDR